MKAFAPGGASRPWLAFAVAFAVVTGSGLGTAASLTTHSFGPKDFDGALQWNTSGSWSVAELSWELLVTLPLGLPLANLTNLSPSLVLSGVSSFQLAANLSNNAKIALEWTVILNASAATNTTFVVHFRASGDPFSPISGSAYFHLPLSAVGPWTLHLFAPLAAANPPPSLTTSLIGVFACSPGGMCP